MIGLMGLNLFVSDISMLLVPTLLSSGGARRGNTFDPHGAASGHWLYNENKWFQMELRRARRHLHPSQYSHQRFIQRPLAGTAKPDEQ